MTPEQLQDLLRRADEVKAELKKKIDEYDTTHAEFIEMMEDKDVPKE